MSGPSAAMEQPGGETGVVSVSSTTESRRPTEANSTAVKPSDKSRGRPLRHAAFESDEDQTSIDRFPTRKEDFWTYLHNLKDDSIGLANWNNAALLALSAGAAVGIRQDLDREVRENTGRHPDRWGDSSQVLGKLGETQYHFAGIALLYGYSRHQQDRELLELSHTLFSAVTLTGLATVATKAIADTDRPSSDWVGGKLFGDRYGFPSGHASSTFAMAAVLEEYYGCEVGLPAYALAGLISWSRIDERDHDLSDVVFGAAMGYVIGKSVAGRHLTGDGRVRILPWVHPGDGSSGLLIDWRY